MQGAGTGVSDLLRLPTDPDGYRLGETIEGEGHASTRDITVATGAERPEH